MTTDHNALRELVDAYVLGGLDADERRAVESHLETCEACAQEVRELRRVCEAMGQLVEQREPPPHLRARVLASVDRPPADGAADPIRPTTSRRSSRGWLQAAAAIVALGIAFYALSLRGRVTHLEADLRDARRQIADSERELAQLREAAGTAQRVAAILAARDISQVELQGQPAAPKAQGRVVVSRSGGAVLSASGLPPLAAGKVYQLWIVTASGPLSLGLITPDAAGFATLATDLPRDIQPRQFAVTIEPAGGVPAPTGAMFLAGAL